jgi:SET domain-containing protein
MSIRIIQVRLLRVWVSWNVLRCFLHQWMFRRESLYCWEREEREWGRRKGVCEAGKITIYWWKGYKWKRVKEWGTLSTCISFSVVTCRGTAQEERKKESLYYRRSQKERERQSNVNVNTTCLNFILYVTCFSFLRSGVITHTLSLLSTTVSV